MSDQTRQRAWRALCTRCGAPVEFQSAASPMAVCSYCRSTLVRDGETLSRIGESAELFDDHSPLSLGVRGKLQGESFTLVGRIQLAYLDVDGETGRWTEWHALFDNGRSGTLSEDNGAYVFTFPLSAVDEASLPDLLRLGVGSPIYVAGRDWVLSSRVQAKAHAAMGELPDLPNFKSAQPVVELRNPQGEILSIEPQRKPMRFDLGRSVSLNDLQLTGLAGDGRSKEASMAARSVECPQCGTDLAPSLDTTQTIVCGSCHSVVDLRSGVGGKLKSYKQNNGLEPLIPLGTVATFKVLGEVGNWQVVGYQERCDQPADPEEETTFWREYLLYNQKRGFVFLVDAEDGWSVVRPVTGVPASRRGDIEWQGVRYRKRYTYTAKTTYVLGEFYWPVRKEQRTLNMDYAGEGAQAHRRLNCEQTGQELVWSAGETITAAEVMAAFRIAPKQARSFQRDASLSSDSTQRWQVIMWLVVAAVIVMGVVNGCTDECQDTKERYGEYSNEYRQCREYSRSHGSGHGGSYGGYSSGGSHK